MDIYLIRHTKTDTVNGLCYGQSDVALAETFEYETQQIRYKLQDLSTEALIISSPLSRCFRLAQMLNTKAITDERLREVDFGDWENRRFDDIDPQLLRQWTVNFVTSPPPNGESFGELCERAASFWLELLAKKPAEQVVLVTHAGVIRALFVNILQLPPENAFKLRVDAGSIHKLRYSNDYTYIDFINL